MRSARGRALALAVLLGTAGAWASPAVAGGPVAMQRPETQPSQSQQAAVLQVTSSAFQPNGSIPMDQSAYGRNISPALSWTAGPPGTRAYALIVEDPDASGAEPVVHWLAWDIPADAPALAKAMRNVERPRAPAGMVQGANSHGSLGYSGPHPPVGDPPHHYHFQVFALDRPLRLRPGADRGALLTAMAPHVLARGELVGLYMQPPARPPRGPGSVMPATR